MKQPSMKTSYNAEEHVTSLMKEPRNTEEIAQIDPVKDQQQHQDRLSSQVEDGDQQQISGSVYKLAKTDQLDEKREMEINDQAATEEGGVLSPKPRDSGFIRGVEIDYKGVPYVKRENDQYGALMDDFGVGSVDNGSNCASPLLPGKRNNMNVARLMAQQREEVKNPRKPPRQTNTLTLTALDESWRKQDATPGSNNLTAGPTPIKHTEGKMLNSDISEELLASAGSQPGNI